jgi:NAD(P)-dependent dehydrogenase (short-subunit alcohol dehydrogenase family)
MGKLDRRAAIITGGSGGIGRTAAKLFAAEGGRVMLQWPGVCRCGEPDEVARIMLFLARDDGSFCTGGVFLVDGGVSAGLG